MAAVSLDGDHPSILPAMIERREGVYDLVQRVVPEHHLGRRARGPRGRPAPAPWRAAPHLQRQAGSS